MPVEPFSPVQSEPTEGTERWNATELYLPPPMTEPSKSQIWLVKRLVHFVLCITIPLAVWVVIIRWSTEKIQEKISETPKYDMMKDVKKFEIKELDIDAMHKAMGIGWQEDR